MVKSEVLMASSESDLTASSGMRTAAIPMAAGIEPRNIHLRNFWPLSCSLPVTSTPLPSGSARFSRFSSVMPCALKASGVIDFSISA